MKKCAVALWLCVSLFAVASAHADGPGFTQEPRYIIGKDDRFPISRPEDTGLSPVGFVLSLFPDYSLGQCSGTLIRPDLVLTAGHCLEKNGMRATDVLFAPAAGPGYFKPSLPYGVSFALKWTWWLTDTPQYGVPYYDIGFLRLERSLGNQAGYYLLLEANESYSFQFGSINGINAGYPGDLQFSSFEGLMMWASACSMQAWSSALPGLFISDCDIWNGNSGGPFFIRHTDGYWYVYAISILQRGDPWAWNGLGVGWGQAVNYFTPITEEIYDRAIQILY